MDAPEPTAATNPHAGDAREGTIVSVELLSFDDESVAATLGDEWHRVEAGVFERPGATDRPDRVDNYSNPWFPVEGYDGTESIQLTRYIQPGCNMVALARINVPQCPGAFLHVEPWGSCSP